MKTNEAIDAILSRQSIRSYKPDPIPADLLAAIIAAGQAAPYVAPDSRHFTVIQDRQMIARLNATAIVEGVKTGEFQRNLFSAPGFDGTYSAPVVLILAGNKHTVQYEAVCAASIQNMLIAARSLGIASCWAYFPIFAFHGQAAGIWREELHIPADYEPCAAVLLGYAMEDMEKMEKNEDRYQNSVVYL